MNKINTLIVGQGIAGTMVAFMLHQRKIPFAVIDPGSAVTSSRIAGGMFTPISGKRKTIQPLVLQQIPFAIEVYQEIEKLLGISIIHLNDICQVHHSLKEKEELEKRMSNADFAKYIVELKDVPPGIKQAFGAFGITQSGWVDCGLMINSFAKWLQQNSLLIQAMFSYNDIRLRDDGMEYQGIEFNNIVFCEGYTAVANPFFSNENIIPCKGDILTVKTENFNSNRIIKKNGIYLIPAGNDLFRAGSTYHWNNNDTETHEADQRVIENELDSILENKFTTISHATGIRPTTQNREPVAKQHPKHKGMFMLNGLGTKGVLQGPWWAKYIVEKLK